VIGPNSAPRAAAVLNAADPGAALHEHEQSFGRSTIKPADKISADTAHRLDANAELMDGLGISGTPAVIYKDKTGTLRMATGLPQPDQINAIFGP
jgi:thiol:disulfide interchange protein DsbG